jgi:hypothetical protein
MMRKTWTIQVSRLKVGERPPQ